MKLFQQYVSLLIVLFLSPLLSFSQERITEHTGEGTNTAFHNIEYNDILYLIRVTQCDEVEVYVVDGHGEYTRMHTITIPDAFGQGYNDVRFTNEYMCFASKDGLVAYNFVTNNFTLTALPDPWHYSLFWTVLDYRLQVALRLPDESDSKVAIYDIREREVTLLEDSRTFSSSRGQYFVEIEYINGLYSYYMYDEELQQRYLLIESSSKRTFIRWENDTTLVYLNKEGVLETYNVVEKSFTNYSSIVTDVDKRYTIYVGKEYLIVGSRTDARIYDLMTKEFIAEKYFDQRDHIGIYNYDCHDNAIVAYLTSGAYIWNLNTDEVEYFGSAQFDDSTIYPVSENKSLIRIYENSQFFKLGIVNHDDLSVDTIDISLHNVRIYNSTFFEKDGYYYLNLIRRYSEGINTMVEVDAINLEANVIDFDETNSGFPYRSKLFKLNNAKVVFSQGSSYPQRLFDFDDKGEAPIDSTDIHWYALENGKVYYHNDEDRILHSYDGTREELIVQDEHPLISSRNIRFKHFSDYENVLLLSYDKLYAYDKSNSTLSTLGDKEVTGLIRYGSWTYYTNENGLIRVDSLLDRRTISSLELDIEDYFVYQDELHVYHDTTLYKITESGFLEEVIKTNYRQWGSHRVVSPNSNHLLFSTIGGTLHYDGESLDELDDTFFNPSVLTDNIIYNHRDLMYLLNEKEVLPFPDILKTGSLYYFQAYGVSYIAKSRGLGPHAEVDLYRVNADLTSIEFISSHRGSLGYRGAFNFIEFDNASLLFMSGFVYTFSKDSELKKIPDLINTVTEVIIEDEDVYFLAYDKHLGNQVYRWNQSFASGTTEQVITKQEVTLYPNPNSGILRILNNSSKKVEHLELINSAGRVLYQQDDDRPVGLENYPSGMYYTKILFDDRSIWTGKVIVE